MKTHASFVLIAILLLPGVSFAQQLTITGKSDLVIRPTDGGYRVAGTYVISNLGPEPARDVFPSFRLAAHHWQGEPKILQAQQNGRWEVSVDLPSDALSCDRDVTCAGLLLPSTGTYPILVTHHYKDWSYSASSSPDVFLLPVEKRQEQQSSLPFFPITLEFAPHPTQLLGKLTLKNISPSIKRVAVSFHTTDELEVLTKPFVLELPPSQVSTTEIKVENRHGMTGSIYGFYVVFQWEEFSSRQSYAGATTLALQRSDGFSWLSIGLSFFLLQLVILCIVLFKRRVFCKSRKK